MKTLNKFENSSSDKSILFTTDVSARGLDIPEVDIVIQIDPPTDPSMFLHRCGRCGRANKSGIAITMLSIGREEEYIDFLKIKGITLKSMEPVIISEEENCWYDETLKVWLREDRSRYDQAIRSYVGYVRYYSKHLASSIFRVRTLDYKGVARMYGLTRLPKMPENKYVRDFPEDGYLDHTIDFNTYAYADKKKRQQESMNF
ncbi:putative spb4-like dead box rna helicase [Brettanomyces bruxellensis AWRI1499]|nr:putative spb4-like dead box rna helicase [Brettanomyces bruxellensis AWRI1499]